MRVGFSDVTRWRIRRTLPVFRRILIGIHHACLPAGAMKRSEWANPSRWAWLRPPRIRFAVVQLACRQRCESGGLDGRREIIDRSASLPYTHRTRPGNAAVENTAS